MTIGDRIHSLREHKGMTLKQLAACCNVTEATMQRYESGEIQNIPAKRVTAIANALGTTQPALFGWTEDELDMEVRVLARDVQTCSPALRKKAIALVRLLLQDEKEQ